MNASSIPTDRKTIQQAGPHSDSIREMIEYYEEVGPDYSAWSPEFNMHFGDYVAGMNPFRREAMLEPMNTGVFRRMDFDDCPGTILDAGYGPGTPTRMGSPGAISLRKRLDC